MSLTCPSCGRENPDDARFCSGCASPLAGESVPAREERKVVTVLFCDLVGFTARSETLDPEDVRALLSGYHELVRGELERHGGTVEKFAGDAVMALFGAPRAHEDDPERAVRAALSIRDRAGIHVRIGITTGEALVTVGARPESGEAMASGDVVNTASRLQVAAPESGILVDESTFRATRKVIDYREREAVGAKGKSRPVPAWEAVEARSSFGVDVEQQATTALVGRQAELQLLVDALARTRSAAEPQLVTLVGVPGIGKSRLVTELFRVVDEDPELIAWRQGRSLPYGEGVSYWALAEMVKAQAGILVTDSVEEAEQKLASAVGDVAGERAEWIEQHLRPLVGLSGAAGEDRRAEAFAAWRAFLEAVAERMPTVLVFEDVQWADDGLLDFVDHLVEWASGIPLLVVCTARPELLARRPGWGGGKPNASSVSLSPLSQDETARLVHGVLERAVLPADLQATLLRRAGGNPLYAEEFARMVAERGELGDQELPETVQGIIAARLDVLTADEKTLLQDAAVVGKVFWTGALATLGDRDRHAVEELLHGLERREFVRRERRSSVAGEGEYAFRHLLVRDVAYTQIPRAGRAEKHRLAAGWIEELGRNEDHAEMLAHHYLQAIEFARAAGLDVASVVVPARSALVEAGERARSLSAYEAARRFYGAALELAEERDPRLVLRYGEACFYFEGEGEELLTEARDALVRVGDLEPAAEAEIRLAGLLWRRGEHDRAEADYERAIELLRDAPPSRTKAEVLLAAARAEMIAGHPGDAITRAGEALGIADELDLPDKRAEALITLGYGRAERGEEGAEEQQRAGLELAAELNSPAAITGYFVLADHLIEQGDLQGGFEARDEARRLTERFGAGSNADWLRGERPGELYMVGRWDEALRLAEDFVSWSCGGHRHYLEGLCRQVRGGILLTRGELDRALDDGARALELSRGVKDPQALFPALAFAARVYLLAGRSGEAEQLLGELLERVHSTASAPIGYAWLRSTAISMRGLGRGGEFVDATAVIRRRTPWLDAATAVASDDLVDAAERYAALGAMPDEAFTRLAAAEALVAAGRRSEGEVELARALEFFRSAGATALTQRAERLLAASA